MNLIIAHVNATAYRESVNSPNFSTSSSSSRNFSQNNSNNPVDNTFDAIKQTCQNLFTSITDLAFDATAGHNRPQPAPPPRKYASSSNNSSNNNYSNISSQPHAPNYYNSSSSGSHRNSSSNSSHFSVGQSPTSNGQQININDNNFQYDNINSTTPQPGPSGQTTIHPSISNRTVSSTGSTSSFEDLGAVGGFPPMNTNHPPTNGITDELTSNSSDITNQYHIVQRQSNQHQNHERPTSPPPSSSSKYRRIASTTSNIPSKTTERSGQSIATIQRSQSDALIIENSHARRLSSDERTNENISLCCILCRQKISELNLIVRNFRKELDNLSNSEQKIKFEEFLELLEHTYSIESINANTEPLVRPTNFDINIEESSIQGIPISDDTQLSPYSGTGDIDEGIYVYPTIRFIYDEHSNSYSNGGSGDTANGGSVNGIGGDADGSSGSYSFQDNAKKRFKLSDVNSKSDLNDLSVKQLKEILMLNRVDYKGCCEKTELLERVQRLWQAKKSSPGKLIYIFWLYLKIIIFSRSPENSI